MLEATELWNNFSKNDALNAFGRQT